MASDQPFQHLFETFGKLPESHVEDVNRKARERMKECLNSGLEKPGHCILLRAPRAGHGKTHLLTRLQYELGGTHEFIPLHAMGGSRIDATTVLDDTLRRLVRPLPAAAGLTVMDLVARRLFSSSLQPLVRSGEVPCQDREGALTALRTRPIETFDFHHPSAVTAHWARENFELLGPRLSLELSQRNGLSLREVSFWVNAMFRFTATPIDNPGRVRALSASVFDDQSAETDAHERLVALLGLLTSLMRVVVIADELEGFSSDEAAALRFASFIGAIRQSVDKLDVVISINQDVWESAFLPRLSGGLADRLSEVVVELEPLDRAAKIAILESRSPNSGAKILESMDSDSIPTYARGLLKKAAESQEKSADSAARENEKDTGGGVSPSIEEDFSKPEEEPSQPGSQEPVARDAHAPADPDGETPGSAPTSASPSAQTGMIVEDAPAQAFASSFRASAPTFAAAPTQADSAPTSPSGAPETTQSQQPDQAQSWPSPEVPESRFGAIPESAATPAPQEPSRPEVAQPIPTREVPAPVVSEEPAKFSPPEPDPVRPAASEVDPSSGFEALEPQQQESKTAESSDGSADKSVDRVDDLLKQFRERYGKS